MPQNDFVTFAGMRGCLMGVALTCSAGVLSPASADTPTSNPAQLEDVIVTAQRRSESLQEVPISLKAITGDKLESLGITTFADVAAMIPNLALGTGNGSGGAGSGFGVSSTRSIAIRGVSGDNTTGLYLNDTPIPTSLDPRLLDVEARRGAARSAGHPLRSGFDGRRRAFRHARTQRSDVRKDRCRGLRCRSWRRRLFGAWFVEHAADPGQCRICA